MSESRRTTAGALPGAPREARETLLIRNGKPAFPKNKKLASLAKQLEQSLCMPTELGDRQTLLGMKFSTIFESGNKASDAIEAALLVETRKRFDALIKHYNLIDRKRNADTFLLLALALANDFVPNFDVRNPGEGPGRPRTRGKIFGLSFLREVERVEKSRGRGVEDAIAPKISTSSRASELPTREPSSSSMLAVN
jgi:hypothetical protein